MPTPCKSVKQMAKKYEGNIILPPPEFRDDYRPIPTPSNIEQTENALKGYTKSYEISIKNNKDPLFQLQNTRKSIEYFVNKQLNEMKGLKYVET